MSRILPYSPNSPEQDTVYLSALVVNFRGEVNELKAVEILTCDTWDIKLNLWWGNAFCPCSETPYFFNIPEICLDAEHLYCSHSNSIILSLASFCYYASLIFHFPWWGTTLISLHTCEKSYSILIWEIHKSSSRYGFVMQSLWLARKEFTPHTVAKVNLKIA